MKKESKRTMSILLAMETTTAMLLTGCGGSAETPAEQQAADAHPTDEVTVAIGGENTTGWDPCTGWGQHCNPLFQSKLTVTGDNGLIANDLATGYSVSEDGPVWTFTVREDAVFSDG